MTLPKHSVIATLAEELDLPVTKTICIYAMVEEIVTGTNVILEKYHLLYRKAVEEHILTRNEMKGIDMKTVLHAREEGIALLKSKV